MSEKSEYAHGKQKRLLQIIPQIDSLSVEPEIDEQNISNDNCEELVNRLDVEHNSSYNMDQLLRLFDIKIANGPIYVCSICLQTWFRRSVSDIELLHVSCDAEQQKLNQC